MAREDTAREDLAREDLAHEDMARENMARGAAWMSSIPELFAVLMESQPRSGFLF